MGNAAGVHEGVRLGRKSREAKSGEAEDGSGRDGRVGEPVSNFREPACDWAQAWAALRHRRSPREQEWREESSNLSGQSSELGSERSYGKGGADGRN
jgi:hypothetical protein